MATDKPAHQLTWKDVLAGNRNPENGWHLRYVPSDDSDVIEYSYDDVPTEVNRWQFTLVGAPMGMGVSYSGNGEICCHTLDNGG